MRVPSSNDHAINGARRNRKPASNRQPDRLEVVTHVSGTICYLCLRSGQPTAWWSWSDSNQPPKCYGTWLVSDQLTSSDTHADGRAWRVTIRLVSIIFH